METVVIDPQFEPKGLGLTIFQERYAHGDETWDEACRRVARTVAAAETNGKVAEYEDRFYAELRAGRIMPGGRIWYGAGRRVQSLLNCFVIDCEDSREGWGKSVSDMMVTSGVGGGVGCNFSKVRGRGYKVGGTGGVSTGSVSIMQMWDRVGDILVSGGGRRLALMLCLNIDHPDIEEFLEVKLNRDELNNANISVVIPSHISTEEFQRLVREDGEIPLKFNGVADEFERTIKARDFWNTLVQNAWDCGEPGVLNMYLANKMNNISYAYDLPASNPCFTADMRLLTTEGYKTFGELYAAGHPVDILADNRVSYNPTPDGLEHPENWQVEFGGGIDAGTTTRVATQVELTQKQAEVVKVTTVFGQEITCTPDHHFATDKGMVEAQHLTTDDKILVALPEPGEPIVGREPETDEEKAMFLMGLIAGDGRFATTPKNHSVFADVWGDEAFANKVHSYMSDLAPNYDMSMYRSDAQVATMNYVEKRDLHMVGSLPLAKYLKDTYGFEATTKQVVPEAAFTNSTAAKFYLSGLFYADGTVNVSKKSGSVSVRLAQSHKKMLQDVQLALHANGVMSRLYPRRKAGERLMPDGKGGSKMYDFRDQYELTISASSRFIFGKVIGFGGHPAKDTKLQKANTDFPKSTVRPYSRVVSVEPAGHADVYCLQEPEARTIIVNGCSVRRCGEQMLPPGGSCNLGHLVLPRFVKDGKVDWDQLDRSIRLGIRFHDNVIDVNHYPLDYMKDVGQKERRIGFGVMGLHSMLLDLGMKYDSPEAHKFIDKLFGFIKNTAYDTSINLAIEKGPFPLYRPEYANTGFAKGLKRGIRNKIKEYGIRNCALLTVAPTGTVSMIHGVTGGIEPLFSPVYIRRRKVIDDKAIESKISTLVVSQEYLDHTDVVQGAYDVSPRNHMEIQKIVQKHVDSSLSKTINLPKDFPVETLADLWLEYLPYMKGSTFYRQGSRGEEPMEHVPVEDMQDVVDNWEGEIEYEMPEVNDCASGSCEI